MHTMIRWKLLIPPMILGLILPSSCTSQDQTPSSIPPGIVRQFKQHGQLWHPDFPVPHLEDLSFPIGIRHVRIENSQGDRFKFLHDPLIALHRETLFAGWYNCPQREIIDESLIRGRRSYDRGITWSGLEIIAADQSGTGIHYVPAQMISHQGVLHAFVGKMTGHDLITACTCYTLDDKTNEWKSRGEIADRFLPNCQPIRLDNGQWIMAGRVSATLGKKPFIPAVALSEVDQLTTRWLVVPLQQKELTEDQCPETTVWVEHTELVAVVRNNADKHPFVFTSVDTGRSWQPHENASFEAATSKLYAGRLSTGQFYVVYNWPAEGERGYHNRSVLAIAVSRPGEFALSTVWRVQDCSSHERPIASHYPCAIEHDDQFYVVYTASVTGRRECELAIIPVSSLTLENPTHLQ